MDVVKVGVIGSGFVANVHLESFGTAPNAEVVAIASPTKEHVQAVAEQFGVAKWFTDYHDLLALAEIDMVTLALPNHLHAQACIDAAQAGKHVVCEKPMCLTLADADRMIEACREAKVKLMYAEELCFAPKYVRAKQLVEEGALGQVFRVWHGEEHFGPHAPWFWDVDLSGGGVLMDMGCHSIEFSRWIYGKQPIRSVYSELDTHVHSDKTRGEDHAVTILKFADGGIGICENSWAKRGGMDDVAEINGSLGITRADLLRGSSLSTYSEAGYGYAVEKAATTKGWTFTMFEEAWNYGFPQEMAYFARCVAEDLEPLETGEDGKQILEVIYAAYESARQGAAVDLPFRPPEGVTKPIDLWRP
jgi:myo-inositol 2-dehydrogenase/D-chiro-inositol 1-dehydrogenase